MSELEVVQGANRLLLKLYTVPTNVPMHSALLLTLVSVQVYSIPCSTIRSVTVRLQRGNAP